MATVPTATTHRIICHCLRVTENEIRETIVLGDCRTLRDVRECTGAGSGCTACHRHIKRLLSDCPALMADGGPCPAVEGRPDEDCSPQACGPESCAAAALCAEGTPGGLRAPAASATQTAQSASPICIAR